VVTILLRLLQSILSDRATIRNRSLSSLQHSLVNLELLQSTHQISSRLLFGGIVLPLEMVGPK